MNLVHFDERGRLMSRVLLMSDIHYCHMTWHGQDAKTIMGHMINALNEEYRKEPYDMILMLGDYSLDHWGWRPYGCYINEGVSYTEWFMKEFASQIPCPFYMIPGNHEQYGNEDWKRITGFDRRMAVAYQDSLFIMLDNYSADLNPTEHSDGTYTPSDVSYIREQMAQYPHAKHVFLCAHEFLMEKESEEFKALLREDDRIVALLAGHTHLSNIIPLGKECNDKLLLRTGEYSYSGDIKTSRRGWRELRFDKEGNIRTDYITPACDYVIDGQSVHAAYGKQDGVTLVFGKYIDKFNFKG
jgi:3',5'-cyclic AMP phosphodiesterase CpdA